MASISSRLLRHVAPISAGALLVLEGRRTPRSLPTTTLNSSTRLLAYGPHGFPSFHSSAQVTLAEGSKAYKHNVEDFDYYLQNATVDDLPVLLHKFDHEGQEVWPWIWTHPNEDGPHHVFVGKTITSDIVHRIQKLRRESPQNNILILIADNEASLHQAAAEAGTDASVFDRCHCGIVTGVSLELLNVDHKILMLDDERVIAFDYLTIC